MKLSVFGLGKLGSPLAAWFASANHKVVCYDASKETMDCIRQKIAPVEEPGLAELFEKHGDNLIAADSPLHAAADGEIVFVIVPTPSTSDGSFSLEFIMQCCQHIGDAIRFGKKPLVVITSTVNPMDCETKIVPALEKVSGKKCGTDFRFCYNPEFIALGSIIKNMNQPDYILIGQHTKEAGNLLRWFYRDLHTQLGNPIPPIAKIGMTSAEIAKLATNCFSTMKISYANSLARLCEAMPGASAKDVCDAIGLDTRIGRKYLSPGPVFGGPCFPRDGRAMIRAAMSVGEQVPLAVATDAINTEQVERLAQQILKRNPDTVGILGLSYKTDTHVTEESLAEKLAPLLHGKTKILSHDPCAKAPFEYMNQLDSVTDVLQDSDVVVISTNWTEYKSLSQSDIPRHVAVFDLWGILGFNHVGAHYVTGETNR